MLIEKDVYHYIQPVYYMFWLALHALFLCCVEIKYITVNYTHPPQKAKTKINMTKSQLPQNERKRNTLTFLHQTETLTQR